MLVPLSLGNGPPFDASSRASRLGHATRYRAGREALGSSDHCSKRHPRKKAKAGKQARAKKRAKKKALPAKRKATKKKKAATLIVRNYDEIVSELGARKPQRAKLGDLLRRIRKHCPPEYVAALKRVGQCEITGDFKFLGPRALKAENVRREVPLAQLGTTWWLFATSGTGDGWLLKMVKDVSEVTFLDHDRETKATPAPLGIGFTQWLQLADLMAQCEKAISSGAAETVLRRKLRTLLSGLSRGLADRYPYRL